MRIAGQRRGEAYPEPRVAGPPGPAGGFVQDGSDQPVDALIGLSGITAGTRVPRNAALDPLRVTLPGVTPGDTLLVDFSIGGAGDAEATDSYNFSFFPVVSFDGGGTYFRITNTTGGMRVIAPGAGAPLPTTRCFGMVTIPGGAASAIVEVVYACNTDDSILIFGTAAIPLNQPGTTLYAAEHSTTSQVGPATLVAYP